MAAAGMMGTLELPNRGTRLVVGEGPHGTAAVELRSMAAELRRKAVELRYNASELLRNAALTCRSVSASMGDRF